MIDTANPFPLGIAFDANFCNRVKEREYLFNNIKHGKHSLLVSPRRYGKTSLALQVLHENKYLHTTIDFLLAYDERNIEEYILEGVGQLASQILPFHKKAFSKLRTTMSSLSPKFTFSEEGFKIEFTPTKKPRQTIVDALLSLDQLAKNEKKHATILMDEFQQIATLKNNQSLEAAIRHAVERSKNISYIFSGSNRHLLSQMFDKSSRPLYHLCDRINLDRISYEHYYSFIQAAAKKKWRKVLAKEVIDKILDFTQRHPYYVNVLCSRLWHEKVAPNIMKVENIWKEFAEEERNRLSTEIALLSPNQRAVLATLAKNPTKEPGSKTFLAEMRLSSSSNIQALKVLQEKDLIYRDASGLIRPLNPVVGYIYGKTTGK